MTTNERGSKAADIFAIAILVLTALSFIGFGVKWLVNPVSMAAPLGITLNNGDATSDARAVYGGMELGLGLFLLYSCAAKARRSQGLAAAALTLGGLGVTRAIGIAVAVGGVGPGTYQLLVTDFLGIALTSAAFFVSRSRSAP